jgi:hypothetical protein
MGLPGITGFPHIAGTGGATISPHVGLPGVSGLPSFDDDRGRRRHHHHSDDFDDFVGYGEYYGDGDGYVDTIPLPDQFGFFATGGFVTMDRDQPVYHYDRSYPYEFGKARTTAQAAPTSMQCQMRTVWDEDQRKAVPVRVCGGY